MPAPPKTTDEQIVQAARQLIERDGRDGFSMRDVAALVGIRAPSLYGRFKDRDSLVGAVELQLFVELAGLLGGLIVADEPEATLMAQAHAIRRFAKSNPNAYSLFFDVRSVPTEEGAAARRRSRSSYRPWRRLRVKSTHSPRRGCWSRSCTGSYRWSSPTPFAWAGEWTKPSRGACPSFFGAWRGRFRIDAIA
jgi:AcrR family transcriptional regulator